MYLYYDPSISKKGVLALKTLKLSDPFMNLYLNNSFTREMYAILFPLQRKFTNMNFSKDFNSSMRENVVLGRYPCDYFRMFIIPSMIDASNKYETKMYLLSSYCIQ